MIKNQTLVQKQLDCPIAIYQMGKVGSETILYAIKKLSLSRDIYHVHVLAPKNLKASLNHLQSKNRPLTIQLESSQVLTEYLNSEKYIGLKVITGVREPIIQLVSAFFQNIKFNFPHFLNSDGTWQADKIYDHLYKLIANYDINDIKNFKNNCNWFDREFKPALGIDVYQYDFDRANGYGIIKQENLDVLILALESSQNWSSVITDFLNLESEIELTRTNAANNKDYKNIYRETVARLKFPSSHLEKIYSSQYCQHFYSPETIEKFIAKWSM